MRLLFDLSMAPKVRTGSGGLHVYLRKPADVNKAELLPSFGKAIEFKSGGRQMVAAGSIHPETKERYRWDGNTSARFDFLDAKLDDLIPDAPEALLDALPDGAPGSSGGVKPLYKRRKRTTGKPPKRVEQILERDEQVRMRFEGEADGLVDASDSGIDMSLANLLARHRCRGSAIEATLRASREQRGAEKSPEEKGDVPPLGAGGARATR